MSKIAHKPWYTDPNLVTKKLDRWVSRRRPQTDPGQESDWLGWDAWVRTDGAPKQALH